LNQQKNLHFERTLLRDLLLKFPKITGPLRGFYNFFYGEKEIPAIKKILKHDNNKYIFFDIGANYGIYTFLFGKNSQHSFVFEPIEECLSYIEAGYSYKNSTLINKAASNQHQEINFNIPKINSIKIFGKSSIENKFEEFEKRVIECIPIDSLFSNVKSHNPSKLFIKIDVEGHENKVIDGAVNMLSNFDSLLLIEVEERHNKNYFYIFDKLDYLNFDCYYLENKVLKKLSNEEDIKYAMKNNNNFIFKNY